MDGSQPGYREERTGQSRNKFSLLASVHSNSRGGREGEGRDPFLILALVRECWKLEGGKVEVKKAVRRKRTFKGLTPLTPQPRDGE